MREFKYILILILIVFYSCKNTSDESEPATNNKIENDTSKLKKNVCICDSVGFFETKGKLETQCYVGNSRIKISHYPNSDTMDVRRYNNYRFLEEVIEVLNGKMVNQEYAMYCDFKDTSGFYKLTFLNNEFMYEDQNIKINAELGVEFISNEDTLKSKTCSILIPKDKFKGIVKFEQITDLTHKGKRRVLRQPIDIETKWFIAHGNLLEQYKAIKNNCDFSNADYIK